MRDDIQKIIADGILAPSGENCQPWKFEVKNNQICIFNVPEADTSLYNYNQKGSYVAHGALLENMAISAQQYGYRANVDLFPDSQKSDLVAIVNLDKDESKNDPLYQYLEKRCTNRRDFNGQKLTQEQKDILINTARETGLAEFIIIDDDQSLDNLGKALAVNERIIFENRKLHDFFYDHIIWKKEEQSQAGGFYIETLEFLPHQLKGVKLFKNWFILKVLNKLAGVSKMIVKENAAKYTKSGTFGAIVVSGQTNKDFVNAGRAMQRVWLAAMALGLSVHPCTGVLYLHERINAGDTGAFSKKHLEIINNAYNDISDIFGLKGRTAPMLFRIGHADNPTARAVRTRPNIIVQ